MAKEVPATGNGRYLLVVAGAEMKEIPEFVTRAKAIRRGGIAKPARRTISTYDPAMILLDAVIEMLAG